MGFAGLALSVGLDKVVAQWSIGNLNDPVVLVAVSVVLFVATMIAAAIPANRAASIQPADALRIRRKGPPHLWVANSHSCRKDAPTISLAVIRAGTAGPESVLRRPLVHCDRSTRRRPSDDEVVVQVTDFVADAPILVDRFGIVHHPFVIDPNLVNPYCGIAGVADLGGGQRPRRVDALQHWGRYDGQHCLARGQRSCLGDPLNRKGAPTGAVFNTSAAAQQFKIAGVDRNGVAATATALFMFATEDGTIVGWNPGINPSGFDPNRAGTYGIVAVDHSANPTAADGAVYKGLAIATDAGGATFLYATNFRAGTVEVYDASFHRVPLPAGAFTDHHLPHGYAPFNIVLADGRLFVTYAKQDRAKHDDVAGHGHGIVNTFDLSGHMLARFAQHGHLDSPWGLVQAPAGFGQFAGAVLIGNFGNGRIHAFDPGTGKFLGPVINSVGQTILIDGLRSLSVGNGKAGGDANAIIFTAGPTQGRQTVPVACNALLNTPRHRPPPVTSTRVVRRAQSRTIRRSTTGGRGPSVRVSRSR